MLLYMIQTEEDLKEAITELAEMRESEVLVYFTGDKNPVQNFGTAIALDTLPLFYQHFLKLGKRKKISLFLYSQGGHLNAPWPIVNLIREYCEELEIIIPSKALSAATLISLGADKILMTPFSQLSPIDPTGTFQIDEKRSENISIEDVTGYISFAREKIGISEQSARVEILKKISDQIRPSVLGSVNRTHSLIRGLAKKLLNLHVEVLEEERIQKIVDNLVEKLFSHDHLINRKEAQNIGLREIIVFATEDEERIINSIFRFYESKLGLDVDFNPLEILGENTEVDYEIVRAIIESSKQKNYLVSKYKISKHEPIPGQISVNVLPNYIKWETL